VTVFARSLLLLTASSDDSDVSDFADLLISVQKQLGKVTVTRLSRKSNYDTPVFWS
jgi:hypothetical protein